MKIGLQPPTSGRFASPALIAELAELADGLGYASLHVTDHVVVPAQVDSRYPYNASGVLPATSHDPYFEPISLLGYLAGHTRRIRLGTSVLVLPYRQPVVAAKQLACIDALSAGRLFLGIGAGWMEEEFRILGAPPYAERGAITDEYIEVFRTLWREDVPQFSGHYVHFPPVGAQPQPAQRPGIPILVGGNTRPALRRAVRLGDGWMPIKLPPDLLAAGLRYLRDRAQETGRDLDGFQVSLRLGLRMTAGPTECRESEADPTTLVGPAQAIIRSIQAYRDLGVTEIAFDFRTCANEDEIRETVRLCGEQVVPAAAG